MRDKCFILTIINQQSTFEGFNPVSHRHLIQDACVLPLSFPTCSTDTHLPPRTSWWGHEGCSKSAAGGFPTRSWARAMTSPCSSCHWRVTSSRHDRAAAAPSARPRLLTPSELWVGAGPAGEEEVLKATLPESHPPLPDMSFVVVSPGENWIRVVLLFPVYVYS